MALFGWFEKSRLDPQKVEDLQKSILETDLEGAQIKRTWFGRKIVKITNGREEDVTAKVNGLLKDMEGHIDELSFKSRNHAVKILTKLDSLYKAKDRVSAFNPNSWKVRSIHQESLLWEIEANCQYRCETYRLEDAISGEIFETSKKIASSGSSKQILSFKRKAVQLLLDPQEDTKLLDDAFIEKAWKKVEDLWMPPNEFYKKLDRNKPIILKTSDSKEGNPGLKRSIKTISASRTLKDGTAVSVPGDFSDSILRTVTSQVMGMKYSELHINVQKQYSEKDLQATIDSLESGSLDQKTHQESLQKLGDVFLLDLVSKLGPNRRHLLEPLLIAVEQAPRNYMLDMLLTQIGSKQFQLAASTRAAVRIQIPGKESEAVKVSITADYPRTALAVSGGGKYASVLVPAEVQGTLTLTFKPLKTEAERQHLRIFQDGFQMAYSLYLERKDILKSQYKEGPALKEAMQELEDEWRLLVQAKNAEEAKCLQGVELSFHKLKTPARMDRYLLTTSEKDAPLSSRELEQQEKREIAASFSRINGICKVDEFDAPLLDAEIRNFIKIYRKNTGRNFDLTALALESDGTNLEKKKQIKEQIIRLLTLQNTLKKELLEQLEKESSGETFEELEQSVYEVIGRVSEDDIRASFKPEIARLFIAFQRFSKHLDEVVEKELL